MKQKRQQFQKEIRREALEKIFRKKREMCFNFNSKSKSPSKNLQSLTQQLTLQCSNELSRYGEELNEGLNNENIEGILAALKDSYYEMKRILIKGKESNNVAKCLGENWFKYGFDKLLISVIKMFERIDKNSFCGTRKQIYRYAIMHFHIVFKQHTTIGAHINSKEIFNFLFLAIIELSNLPESINQILLICTYLLNQSKQMRHEFLFQNYKLQLSGNQQLLSFEHIIYIMFQNREKFRISNTDYEQDILIYREIKMNFIWLFRQYGYEMKEMEKYITNCRKSANGDTQDRATNDNSTIDTVYENSLKLHKYPSQIKLKYFLQKQTMAIVTESINQMRIYYLSHWATQGQSQQYLSECIQATRMLIDFSHNTKFMQSLQDQLGDIICLLTINNVNIQVKNQTLYLIDSIIYSDENNVVTEFLIKNHNLFEKLWSYQQQSIFTIKMNAVNNLLLCTAGFHAVNRYLGDIVITLHGTEKFIALTLTFINNYFIHTKFDLHPTSRVDLLIELLYSLPKEKFTIQNLQHECYILTHLYDNGFTRQLPQRYEQWNNELMFYDARKHERVDQENFYQIVSKMTDIYSHYAKQSSGHLMEYQ